MICKLPTSFDNNNSPSSLPLTPCKTNNNGEVTAIYLAQDGHRLYGGDTLGYVYVWSTKSGKVKQTMGKIGYVDRSFETKGHDHMIKYFPQLQGAAAELAKLVSSGVGIALLFYPEILNDRLWIALYRSM